MRVFYKNTTHLSKNLLLSLFVFILLASFSPALADEYKGDFGSEEAIAFSLAGDIYFIEPNTKRLPDFSKLTPVGRIYATELNIPERSFTEGFPGVTDRYEWFAIDYNGTFMIENEGRYLFQLISDDGSKLFIDGELISDNDGVHEPKIRDSYVSLSKGIHKIRLQYFQGPRFKVALILRMAMKGEPLEVYDTKEMSPVKITETKEEIQIVMDSSILFEFDEFVLTGYARVTLDEIKLLIIDKYPNAMITVEGHTDSVGSDVYNLNLSGQRARTVRDWLAYRGLDERRIRVEGYGESRPKYPNTSEENMSKNRRVEIRITK